MVFKRLKKGVVEYLLLITEELTQRQICSGVKTKVTNRWARWGSMAGPTTVFFHKPFRQYPENLPLQVWSRNPGEILGNQPW